MGARSSIEWTDATWNPLRGCSRVSAGCANCYAERVAARFSAPGMPYQGLAHDSSGPRYGWTGDVRLIEEHLRDPLRWRAPRRIFVNSMSDLFHERVPDNWIDRIFMVMADAQHHTFQVLTKRPERMRAYLHRGIVHGVLPNVWLGVSVEDQATAEARIPPLLATGAAIRFVSAEPLLGAIDLSRGLLGLPDKPRERQRGIDWMIVGGESGPGARPMHPDWAAALRDQCAAARVPFFFKQWGEWAPGARAPGVPAGEDPHDRVPHRFLDDLGDGAPCVWRLGKRRAGRALEGKEYSESPAFDLGPGWKPRERRGGKR